MKLIIMYQGVLSQVSGSWKYPKGYPFETLQSEKGREI